MARYRGPVCRLCRRAGDKLFLKGERCFTGACAIERRQTAPGQHGTARGSKSDFSVQLSEKQKVKRTYGLTEKGFRKNFDKAIQAKGMVAGTSMLLCLETRLDNLVYRVGFAQSRTQARQMVGHGHILVNGRIVSKPGYCASVGDVIEVTPELRANVNVQASMQSAISRAIPGWLSLDKDSVRGTVNALPAREDMPQNFREQLVVELYSR